MKTLDEVIEAYRICIEPPDETGVSCPGCPYAEENGTPNCCGDDKEDALHYLVEYQERLQNLQDMMDRYDVTVKNYEEAVKNCREVEQKYWRATNDIEELIPLTWEELTKRKGRPVWVEYEEDECMYKHWGLIAEVFDEDYCKSLKIMRIDSDGYPDSVYLWKDRKSWNAYRRERE